MAICETCDEQFTPDRTAKAGRFCSHRCYWDSMKGQRQEGVEHRLVRAPNHPVSPPSGTVAQARITLYDAIGDGPHECHWCGREVEWMPGAGITDPRALNVDHLDWDPTNDDLSNLVPSCRTCNALRRADRKRQRIQDDELTVVVSGARRRAVRRHCESCGDEFLAPRSQVRVGRGRFCSRSCARRQPRGV